MTAGSNQHAGLAALGLQRWACSAGLAAQKFRSRLNETNSNLRTLLNLIETLCESDATKPNTCGLVMNENKSKIGAAHLESEIRTLLKKLPTAFLVA